MLHVLYLVFNEGYTATSGTRLERAELTAEAIRLARELHRLVPGDDEVAGLLALMLLTDARRPARTAPDGSLVPLSEQDRTLWDADAIAEGVGLVTDSACRRARSAPTSSRPPSPPSTTRHPPPRPPTGPQILALYTLLERVAPNPMVTLNRAVAVAMVRDLRPGWPCSTPCRPTSASPRPTTSCPCGPTCWRWPATATRRASYQEAAPHPQPNQGATSYPAHEAGRPAIADPGQSGEAVGDWPDRLRCRRRTARRFGQGRR